MPFIKTVISSFGYGHRQTPPRATITIDTRVLLRDPHIDPGLRELTGADDQVRRRVLSTPGAARLIAHLTDTVLTLLEDAGDPTGNRVDVAIGCTGGRHRSVVLADALAYMLSSAGAGVEVLHLDVHRPVLARTVEA